MQRNKCTPARARGLELKVPPLALAVVVAAAMWGLAAALPDPGPTLPWRIGLAALAFAMGLALVVAGALAFRRANTTVDPRIPDAATRLVTDGVYRWSRNPMYLGFTLCLFAWGVYLAHAGALLLPPGFALYLDRYQIRPEERAMRARFGAAYTAYSRRVRRWL